jgi:hypothetical protein
LTKLHFWQTLISNWVYQMTIWPNWYLGQNWSKIKSINWKFEQTVLVLTKIYQNWIRPTWLCMRKLVKIFWPKIDFDQIKIWANWNCSAKLGKVNLTKYKFDQNDFFFKIMLSTDNLIKINPLHNLESVDRNIGSDISIKRLKRKT